MNKGDCFIFDSGKEIYLYIGPQAKGTERMKAINVANQIRDQDHGGRAKINRVGEKYVTLFYLFRNSIVLMYDITLGTIFGYF